jgi:hypothetical protein
MHNNKRILKSSNTRKCKTTRDIFEELSRKQHSTTDMQELMIDSKHLKDQQDIVDACNNYFSSVIDKISKNNVDNLLMMKFFSTFHYYL